CAFLRVGGLAGVLPGAHRHCINTIFKRRTGQNNATPTTHRCAPRDISYPLDIAYPLEEQREQS
ncbi:MAG: hypothetical protein V4793_26400, partial [Paraburkholderia tropica]